MTALRALPIFIAAVIAGPTGIHHAAAPLTEAPPAVQTPEPDPGNTPAPTQTPEPGPPDAGSASVITQIFEVVFSADSLSEALSNALEAAALDEASRLGEQTAQVNVLLTGILVPPSSDRYAGLASTTFTTAAALAPALFLVRLVMYHWGRIIDDRDSLLQVFGDWIAAGFLAVSAGPFLDLVVQAGWWMAAAAVGETGALAAQFISVSTVANAFSMLAVPGNPSIFTGVFAIAAGLGGLLGVVGLAVSFAVSQAVLFVMGTTAPVIAILAVVPQMRWIRGIWLKAAAVLALMPVAAGGIFKAGVSLAALFTGAGPIDLIIRLFWLWGAVGFMLSMAGILGKISLSTAVETTGKIGGGVRQILSTAALAAGGGSFATGAAAAPTAESSPSLGVRTFKPGVDSGGPPMFNPPPRSQGSGSAAEHPPEMHTGDGGAGLDTQIDSYFRAASLDPEEVRAHYPGDVAGIRAAFYEQADRIAASPEPLVEAARIGGAQNVLSVLEDQAPGTEAS